MAFGNHDGRGEAPMAEINIIPLCDVLLVLLIIFMVTAPALSHQIDLTLPGPIPDQPLTPPDSVNLRIDAAGQVFWNGQATTRGSLDVLMREAGQVPAGQQAPLRIDANGDADYQSVAKVLAMARNAGLENIGFVRK